MGDIALRIDRGRKAIKLAKEKGMDTSSWEKELSGLEALAHAEDVAQRTRELLADPGWCLWKCGAFDGDIIVVCREELANGYPQGYPVYTECELEKLGQDDVSGGSLRLVHEAKKLSGARVITE